MSRAPKVISLGVVQMPREEAPQKYTRAMEYDDKRSQQSAFRKQLDYDSINSIQQDRKPFQRTDHGDLDAGMSIGNWRTDEEKRSDKLASQAKYRKMLQDTAALVPVESSRKSIQRRSPLPEAPVEEACPFGKSARDEALLKVHKARDAIEYRNQLQGDIAMRQKHRNEVDRVRPDQLGGFNIGSEKAGQPHAKKSVSGSANRGGSNVFPTAADPWDGPYTVPIKHFRSNSDSVEIGAGAAAAAPAPIAKSRAEEYVDMYVNHSGLTGLCVGSQPTKEEEIAEKIIRKAHYQDQLDRDIREKELVQNSLKSTLRYLH